MCFYTTRHQKPKIAKEDIKCWKVIGKNGKSIFYGHKYKKGELQERIILRKAFDSGIGSYDNYEISEGYHSYSTIEVAVNSKSWSTEIFEFVIPKGTRYYHDLSRKEYVSETIMMLDEHRPRDSKNLSRLRKAQATT